MWILGLVDPRLWVWGLLAALQDSSTGSSRGMDSPSGLRPRERGQKAGVTPQVFRFHPEHRSPNPPHPCAGADLGEHRGVPDVAHPFYSVKNEFIPSLELVWLLWRVESRTSACALVALGMDPWGSVPWDVSLGAAARCSTPCTWHSLAQPPHWEGPEMAPVARAKNRGSHSGCRGPSKHVASGPVSS